MRVGRIPWINCYPVYGAIDRGLVRLPGELVSGTASELNDLLAAGELQVSVVSAVEYARNAAAYQLLPDLTASSRTSVLLLELLCRHRWGVAPRFAGARAEATDLESLAGLPHDGVLVIGDAALLLAAQDRYPVRIDLGAEWKAWTGLPFVFAVWAARRDARPGPVAEVHRSLLESRSWGLANLDALARDAAARTGVTEAACRAYLDDLDYALSDRHLAGLTDFFRRLAQDGLVPDGSLSFISAA
jgi:chorismate dehydratase